MGVDVTCAGADCIITDVSKRSVITDRSGRITDDMSIRQLNGRTGCIAPGTGIIRLNGRATGRIAEDMSSSRAAGKGAASAAVVNLCAMPGRWSAAAVLE